MSHESAALRLRLRLRLAPVGQVLALLFGVRRSACGVRLCAHGVLVAGHNNSGLQCNVLRTITSHCTVTAVAAAGASRAYQQPAAGSAGV
jgi:hypothetical protein